MAAQDATGKSVRAGALHWSKTKRSPSASRRNADGRLTRPFSSIWNSYRPKKLVTSWHSMGQSGEEWYDRTKIRPYFESRQAFLGPIVFGFCLGGGALQESYKIKRVNELHDQQLTAYHDEFAKNYETKPPPTGFTHFFPLGFWCSEVSELPRVREVPKGRSRLLDG